MKKACIKTIKEIPHSCLLSSESNSKLLKRYHTHVLPMYCYPVPLCLHGHSSLQGLRWEEGVQVDRLPAKVFKHHYFYLIAFLTQLKLYSFLHVHCKTQSDEDIPFSACISTTTTICLTEDGFSPQALMTMTELLWCASAYYNFHHIFINVHHHNQVRNLGDGFDDEECPERESWGWEMRSTRAPGVGIFITGTRSEPDPFKSGKKAWEKLGR